MTKYLLIEDVFAGKNHISIFHSPEFFHLHSKNQGCYFELVCGSNVVASVHYTEIDGNVWRSPARGTYAGYSFEHDLPLDELYNFHSSVCNRLLEKGAKSIELLLPPLAHDIISFSNQFYMLRSDGFEISQCNLNYTIEINEKSLSSRMNYSNQKRLRKCLRNSFIAEQQPISELPLIYKTLEANRNSKGYVMSMTLSSLEEMISLFPESIVLFGSRVDDLYAAAALCFRLSKDILYVFYWGDYPGYSEYSPVVTIADVIYEYCRSQSVKILDIGTSTIDSIPNNGLIRFKRGLGFSESLKINMIKKY